MKVICEYINDHYHARGFSDYTLCGLPCVGIEDSILKNGYIDCQECLRRIRYCVRLWKYQKKYMKNKTRR